MADDKWAEMKPVLRDLVERALARIDTLEAANAEARTEGFVDGYVACARALGRYQVGATIARAYELAGSAQPRTSADSTS